MSERAPRTRFIGPGHIFGRGEVLEEIRMTKGSRNVRGFRLQCTCGNTYEARLDHLVNGAIQSCGCLNQEERRGRMHSWQARAEAAEAKLAAVAEHCRKHAEWVNLHCPDLGRPAEALVKADTILAIIGQEARGRSDEKDGKP